MAAGWVVVDGLLAVRGPMRRAAPHHHAAVQVTAGSSSVEVCDQSGESVRAPVVIVASGVHHTLTSDGKSCLLSIYLSPHTARGAELGGACAALGTGGVWALDIPAVSQAAARAASSDDLAAAVAVVLEALAPLTAGVDVQPPHPLVLRALTAASTTLPAPPRLSTIAKTLHVTPDHLGRLFIRQFGVSFSAAARWMRLLRGIDYLTTGHSVTDAAHLAGFADAAHATRTCWEMAGAPPSLFSTAIKAGSTSWN